jgi:TolB-like protein
VRPRPSAQRSLTASVTIFLLLAVLSVGWWTRTNNRPVEELRIDSLIVLPLENLTGNPDQDYFVAGMHAALIAELGQISALRITSRTSALTYKDRRQSVPEIARDLKVNGILEGAVYKDGEDVRLQVQLVRAVPVERQIWSNTYSGNLRNVLSLQKQIAKTVAEQINAVVTPQEAALLNSHPAVNPSAYDAWIRALNEFHKLSSDSIQKCVEYTGHAISIDAKYAAAHALGAYCHSLLSNLSAVATKEASSRAKDAVLQALQLDETHHLPTEMTLLGQRADLLHQREFVPDETHFVCPATGETEDDNSLHIRLLPAGSNCGQRALVCACKGITDDYLVVVS